MKPNIQVTEFQSEGYSLFSFCKDFFLIELPVFTTVYRNKFMFIKKIINQGKISLEIKIFGLHTFRNAMFCFINS